VDVADMLVMRNIRRGVARRTAVASITVIAAAAATGFVVTQASAHDVVPTFAVRGEPADPKTFALSGLHSSEDRRWLGNVQNRLFEACMSEKGFTTQPGAAEGSPSDYSIRYGEAANGDDGTSSESPTTYSVPLPGGGTMDVYTTWTPDSCAYQMFSQLGSDPIYREALRKRMMILVHQADSLAASQLADLTAEWVKCTGLTNTNAFDLFRAIDGEVVLPGVERPAPACLPENVRRETREVRAAPNLTAATENVPLVTAWVALVDQELSEARRLGE